MLDGAVLVLSAVEGVQAQTRLLWRALESLGIPTLLVVNKVDRLGCDIEGVVRQLREECSPRLLVTQQVEHPGTGQCQILESPGFWEDALAAAAEYDDALAEAFLEDRPVDRERLLASLRKGGSGPAGVPPAVRLGQAGPGHPGAAAGHHPVAALCPRP